MDKEDVHNGLVLSHKRNKILPIATTQMDLQVIMLNEIDTERAILYYTACMWNLTKNKLRERDLPVMEGREKGNWRKVVRR